MPGKRLPAPSHLHLPTLQLYLPPHSLELSLPASRSLSFVTSDLRSPRVSMGPGDSPRAGRDRGMRAWCREGGGGGKEALPLLLRNLGPAPTMSLLLGRQEDTRVHPYGNCLCCLKISQKPRGDGAQHSLPVNHKVFERN